MNERAINVLNRWSISKLLSKTCTGFIEELGQDAAPPVPPPEGPFQQADDEPFDQLGQVLDHLITQ